MRTVGVVVAFASLAYVGTMVDNFVAFAAQLALTPPDRVARVRVAHGVAVAVLVAVAAAIASVLSLVPLPVFALFAVVPAAYAVRAWGQRHQPVQSHRRGATTTFLITFALAGDNLAVWSPLLRADGLGRSVVTIVTFAAWEILFLLGAGAVARHPRVVTVGERHLPTWLPVVYALLALLVVVEAVSG